MEIIAVFLDVVNVIAIHTQIPMVSNLLLDKMLFLCHYSFVSCLKKDSYKQARLGNKMRFAADQKLKSPFSAVFP